MAKLSFMILVINMIYSDTISWKTSTTPNHDR